MSILQRLLPASRKKVARGMYVWISNHYMPTLFGIRGKYETSYKSGQYVETCSPGTGFFIRSSSSHTYKNFCKAEKAKLIFTYRDLLQGNEFSFDREIKRAEAAQSKNRDVVRDTILESYLNVLPMAKEAEENERIVEGIKAMSHKRHRLSSYQTHVMTNYKSRVARLGHDVREVQLSVPSMCGEEEFQRFAPVAIAFSQLAASHRIWNVREDLSGLQSSLAQVYFDMGIFDFIQSPLMTPMMRDAENRCIYLFPGFIIRAKDGVDFEVFYMKDLSFLYREVPYDMVSSMVVDSYYDTDSYAPSTHVHRRNYEEFGDGLLVNKDTKAINEMEEENKLRERVVGELYVQEMKMRYYVRDHRTLKAFVNELNQYKHQLPEGEFKLLR